MNSIKSMAVICDDYPSKNRPTNIFVEQLVNAIVDQGINITVIAPQSLTRCLFRHTPLLPRRSVVRTKQSNAYEVYRPMGLSFGHHFGKLRPLVLAFNRKQIEKVLRKIQVDVLYSHFWHNSIKVDKYVLKKHIPLFVACGEGDNALENTINSLSSKEREILTESVKGVISVSTENLRKCIKYNLIEEDKIVVLPNCVDTNLFCKLDCVNKKRELGIKENDFTIVFVGGFVPRKGPDRVAKAVNAVQDKHIKSIFIGKPFSGYDYDFDCPGIVFKGVANHDDMPVLMNCADVFVLPTLKEGCCNAIVEALACGLPVISSKGSFNDDILDDKNSIRVDPNAINEIAQAIVYLRDRPDVRQHMSENALARHEQYSIVDRARKIIEFINKCLN